MVEIKDIVDRESLEAWLKGQPKRSSIVVASRIALRFLPTLWHFISIQGLDKGKRTAILSALKQNLIADASSHCPTLAIPRNLEDAAAKFASELILPGADIPDAAGEAAAFAADAVYAYHYGDAAASMNKVFFALANLNAVYAEISSLEFLNIVKIDCEELLEDGNLTGVKLWLEFEDPFREIWGKLKSILKEDEVDWSFWVKWYEAALSGEPLNWEMLEKIALIPSEDWEQGPAHVNGLIAKVEKEFEGKTPEKAEPLVAKPISANDAMILMTAGGISAQIASVIERYHADTGRNHLPDEFRILEDLPAHFSRFSQLALIGGARDNASFDKEIADLKAKIETLIADLEIAKSKAVSGVFSKAFLEQAGKSLGDWKMWGALGSAVYYFASASTVTGTGSSLSSISDIANSIREIFPIRP